MKKRINMFYWITSVLVICIAALTTLFWSKRIIWPDFPQTNDLTPQVVTVIERDFAWRTGDHIPVTIFLKQKPNVNIDVSSLALAGDFELASNPDIYVRDNKDGSKLMSVNLVLQSFVIKPKLTMQANMSYTQGAELDPKLLNLPKLELYTSPTWDGRPERKHGSLLYVQTWYYWITGLTLLIGLVGAVGSIIWLRTVKLQVNKIANAPPSPAALARKQFDAIWQRIKSGQDKVSDYKEISNIVRTPYRSTTKTTSEIPRRISKFHPHFDSIMNICTLCDLVLYKGATLTDEQKQQIYDSFDEITSTSSGCWSMDECTDQS